ncbi:MAG: hypothetical protein LBD02_01390 [Christensenellaceae bacterium]|jgi:hypothetical protein|nr:hypothetical protein [Christensenellaceae bacterium]
MQGMLSDKQIPATLPGVAGEGAASSSARAIIGEVEVAAAESKRMRFRSGKSVIDTRVLTNENFYRRRYWDKAFMDAKQKGKRSTRIDTRSAWLLNSLANKHADAMDQSPEPNVLPRAADDDEAAKVLSGVLPVVLEQAGFESVYRELWWDKLKHGCSIAAVTWDSRKLNGLGDVGLRRIDPLTICWEPGVRDIQDSSDIFIEVVMRADEAKALYPEHADRLRAGAVKLSPSYVQDEAQDMQDKIVVVDWYYKRIIGGRSIVHYARYACGVPLYASENDERYTQSGYYADGDFPFVFDVLFPIADSPFGFGYIDVMQDMQEYIDKLDAVMLENAVLSSKKRFLISKSAGIRKEEIADFDLDFIEAASLDAASFQELSHSPLPGSSMQILQAKIEELKETSGNRDFSQGGTSSGVTAASAIAALQEAGSKLSRDMIATSYSAFGKICYMVIERIRQFYQAGRTFRIIGQEHEQDFVELDPAQIGLQPHGSIAGVDLGERMPIFDVRVTASRKTAFSRISQNELAVQLYQLGFFAPQMVDQSLGALELMDFDGKRNVEDIIRKNGGLMQQIEQMQMAMQQMAMVIDAQNGTSLAEGMAQEQAVQQGAPKPSGGRQPLQIPLDQKARGRAQKPGVPK